MSCILRLNTIAIGNARPKTALANCTFCNHRTPMTSPKKSEQSIPAKRQVSDREFVGMMAALMALNALAIDAMLPAFPAMSRALGVSGSNSIQFVVSAYLLGTGVGSLIHGPLSDRFGRRPMLMGALAGYILFALVCGQTHSFEMFVAMRFAHGLCGAGLGVLGLAIVRDCYEGDAMAKRMSMVFLIFMIVPIIAPTIGQLVLTTAGWRAIYFLFATAALLVGSWAFFRLPETLAPQNVVSLSPGPLAKAWGSVISNRTATAYMLAGGITQGAMYGFLNSSQQIFDRVFSAANLFPYCFAAVAVGMACANFANSRIVERYGARRVSQSATIIYIVMSLLQLTAAWLFPAVLPLFLLLLAGNMALAGFIGSNFGSIAMQPFGAVAGAASSFQNFVRTAVATSIGAFIGQQFDTTVIPIIFGFMVCGIIAILLVLWGERGKLFTRPGTTKHLPM